MLYNKQTPPVMATAALPTLPTLLLPSNSLTITKLPLLRLLLLTLQPYLLAASPECLTPSLTALAALLTALPTLLLPLYALTMTQLLLLSKLLLYSWPYSLCSSRECFNNDPTFYLRLLLLYLRHYLLCYLTVPILCLAT